MKKRITFDEIPATLVAIMDRLTAIERVLKGQKKEPKVLKAKKVQKVKESPKAPEVVESPSGILTAAAACKLIGKAKLTLYHLAKKGKIPARKEGRNWVFVEAELQEWLKKRKSGRKKPTRKYAKTKSKDVVKVKKQRGRPKKEQPVVAVIEQPVEAVVAKQVEVLPATSRRGKRPRIGAAVSKPTGVAIVKKQRGRPKKVGI